MTSAKPKSKFKRADRGFADRGGRLIADSPQNLASSANQEAVRMRAYQLYEERGRVDGHDLTDWLAAEAQVTVGSGNREKNATES
jgi:hypothetical protein